MTALTSGQIEQGDVVLDTHRLNDEHPGLDGAKATQGLWHPEVRDEDQDRPSASGKFANRRLFGPRHISTPLLAKEEAHPRLLASSYSSLERRDLRFCGFGWGSATYRVGAIPATGSGSVFDREAAAGIWLPTLEWDCPDPNVYSDAATTTTISPGATATVVSPGTSPLGSSRVTVSFVGPIVGPGLTSDVYGDTGIVFPDLTLLTGQTLVAFFDWTSTYGLGFLGSPTILSDVLWSACMGYDDTDVYPLPVWLDDQAVILPGSQTFTATGTGGGHVSIVHRDAWLTPPVS